MRILIVARESGSCPRSSCLTGGYCADQLNWLEILHLSIVTRCKLIERDTTLDNTYAYMRRLRYTSLISMRGR